MNAAERRLFQYVQMEIRAGKREIVLPAHLLEHVEDDALKEVRALCTLSGVKVVRVDA